MSEQAFKYPLRGAPPVTDLCHFRLISARSYKHFSGAEEARDDDDDDDNNNKYGRFGKIRKQEYIACGNFKSDWSMVIMLPCVCSTR